MIGASISPDGKVWIASPPEADPKRYRVPPFPETLVITDAPQFSPDGSKIAVTISRHTPASDPEFWILPVPSGAPARTPVRMPIQSYRRYRLSWMPDNRRVVVSGLGRLFILDTYGGEPRLLTTDSEEEYQPAVSPDGRRIAFAAGSVDYDIVEVTLGNHAPKPLLATARSERWPSWSPQGTQYAYVTNTSRNDQIWVRDSNNAVARPLLQHDAGLPWYELTRVHFSPDGRRIAYDLYGSSHVVAISSVAGGPPVIPDTQSVDQHGPS